LRQKGNTEERRREQGTRENVPVRTRERNDMKKREGRKKEKER
jgi:hypothetical protein